MDRADDGGGVGVGVDVAFGVAVGDVKCGFNTTATRWSSAAPTKGMGARALSSSSMMSDHARRLVSCFFSAGGCDAGGSGGCMRASLCWAWQVSRCFGVCEFGTRVATGRRLGLDRGGARVRGMVHGAGHRYPSPMVQSGGVYPLCPGSVYHPLKGAPPYSRVKC